LSRMQPAVFKNFKPPTAAENLEKKFEAGEYLLDYFDTTPKRVL